MTALNSDEARALKDEIIVLEGRLAGLIGLVAQLLDGQQIDGSAAIREARMHFSSPHGHRHAEQVINDLARPKR